MPLIAALIGALYVVAELVYTILAFSNFSLLQILGAFSLLPLPLFGGLLFLSRRELGQFRTLRFAHVLIASLTAFVMLLAKTSSLVRWRAHVTNFPNQWFESTGGFNGDTAMHVSIINSISSRGYPSISQHLEPLLLYHTLSHYADALILTVLSLDPWTSYALLFQIKGIGIVLGILLFTRLTMSRHSPGLFLIVLGGVFFAVTGDWWVIGSHSQWLPTLILLLTAPWVFSVLQSQVRSWRDYALLTCLVIVLSLGKISIGFPFAVLSGFWMLFQNPKNKAVYPIGIVWAGFFFFFAGEFSRESDGSNPGLFWAEINAMATLVLGLLVGQRFGKFRKTSPVLPATLVTIAVTVGVVILAANSITDGFQFLQGTLLVLIALLLPVLLRLFFPNNTGGSGDASGELYFRSATAFGAVFLLVLTPTIANPKASFNPYQDFPNLRQTIRSAGEITYLPLYEREPQIEPISIGQLISSGSIGEVAEPATFLGDFKTALDAVIDDEGLHKNDVLLFLTKEDFGVLESYSERGPSWEYGLLVTAVTGLSLIYGALPSDTHGFRDYDSQSLRKPARDATFEDLCKFNRPVIIASDFRALSFSTFCH